MEILVTICAIINDGKLKTLSGTYYAQCDIISVENSIIGWIFGTNTLQVGFNLFKEKPAIPFAKEKDSYSFPRKNGDHQYQIDYFFVLYMDKSWEYNLKFMRDHFSYMRVDRES